MDISGHSPITGPLTGVIMRFGSGEHADTVIYPDRKLTGVHPARRDEAMSYRIEIDSTKQQPRMHDGWEHFTYRFSYRYMGRTLSVVWHCGTGHGAPKAIDGIQSAFLDAESVAYESFPGWGVELGYDMDDPAEYRKAQRAYDACERMSNRLDAFFEGGEDGERMRWAEATRDR